MSKHGWNYRVIKTVNDGAASFDIHEVYYNAEGRPWAWSEEPVAPTGETLDELQKDLLLQAAALSKPTLEVVTGTYLKEVEDEENE